MKIKLEDIDPRDRFDLDPTLETLLLQERDLHVEALAKAVEDLKKLSALEYLARGIHVHDMNVFELAGRLAKSEVSTIEYDPCKPSWRTYNRGAGGNSYESYADPEHVLTILRGARRS